MCAIENNFITITQLLIENNADVNSKDNFGNTPLMVAAFNNRIDIAKILIKNNANINEKIKKLMHYVLLLVKII